MNRLFLSYRRSDCPGSVERFCQLLRTLLPHWNIFYDHSSLELGEVFPTRLEEEVEKADYVLVLIGPRWLSSLTQRATAEQMDFVREEVRLSLLKPGRTIPLLFENATFPSSAELESFPDLRSLLILNGQSIRPDPDFEQDTRRIIAFLESRNPGIVPGMLLNERYKILRTIGQGGMGIVYEAQDTSITTSDARVAIKMILEGMDTKQVLARFDGEKEALSRFNHPGIASVRDSGITPSGRPYFVMDFIRGDTITTYCDRKKLTTTARLALFTQVCSAIQHAHQKGILHRDIKPSNIIVDESTGTPLPVVIDFGLAKALGGRLTDKTMVSEVGKTVGTLLYSSPEQAAGRTYEIDTRSDIYSLGALLYELLTGEPPFTPKQLEAEGEAAIIRYLQEHEPSSPSLKLSSSNTLPQVAANHQVTPDSLVKQVRGELDWIVMKSLDKSIPRRYETANQFAEDIQRYLKFEPVSAVPPSPLYRLKKYVRRNRIAVAATSAVLIALILGTIGTALGLFEAQRQTERALKEEKTKSIALTERNQALEQAEKNRQLAEDRLKEKISALQEMLDLFSNDTLKTQPGSQPIRKLFLENGLSQYQTILSDDQDNVSVAVQTNRLLRELAQLEKELDHGEAETVALQRAVQIARAQLEQHPADFTVKQSLAQTLYQQGNSYYLRGDREAARSLINESLDIARQLLATAPNNPDYLHLVGRILVRLDTLLADTELNTDGKRPILEGLENLRKSVELRNAPQSSLDLARALSNFSLLDTCSPEEKEKLLNEALSITSKLLVEYPSFPEAHSLLATFTLNKVNNLIAQERTDEAYQVIDQSIRELQQFTQNNPFVVAGERALYTLLQQHAAILQNEKRWSEAIIAKQKAIETCRSILNKNPQDIDYATNEIATYRAISNLHSRNLNSEAQYAALQTALGRVEELRIQFPKSDVLLQYHLLLLSQQSDLLEISGSYGQAREKVIQAMQLYESTNQAEIPLSTESDTLYLNHCNSLLRLAVATKELDPALGIAQDSFLKPEKREHFLKGSRDNYLALQSQLAVIQEDQGLLQDAATTLEQLITDSQTENPEENWSSRMQISSAHFALIRVYRKLEQPEHEFENLRFYFEVLMPYVKESDFTQLLAEHGTYSAANLEKLRQEYDRNLHPSTKRFTLPANNQANADEVYLYVNESWRSIEDQFARFEKSGIKVEPVVYESFSKLYKIAKENNVSFADLCVYALGTEENATTPANSPPIAPYITNADAAAVLARRDQHRKRLQELRVTAQNADPLVRESARIRLLLHLFHGVEDEISLSLNFFNAAMHVEEAKTIMEVNSFGEAGNQAYQPLVPYLDFCEGLLSVGKEEYAKAYERILRSRSAMLADSERQFSVIEGNHEFALGWISAERGLQVEAAIWFVRAMSKNHPYAAHRLYDLCVEHPECKAVLPDLTAKVLEECVTAPGFGIERAQQFVDRHQMAIAERRAKGLALESQSIGQLPFFSGYESEVVASQRLVRQDPSSISARLQLCQNLERLPNYAWAAYELLDVLEMDPKSVDALLMMARIQYRLGNLQVSKTYAQRWYQQLQESEKEETEATRELRLNARLLLADIHFRLAEYKSAIELLESDKFKIEDIEVALSLGILYLSNKDYDQALIHFQRCFNLVDDQSESFFRIGVALHSRGEFAGAVIAFEHSESLGLKNPAYQMVAKSLLEKCQKYKALLDSELGAELPEKLDFSAEDFIALGEAKKNLDSFGDAVQFYQKAFAIQPDLRTNFIAINRWNCIQAAIQAGLGEGIDFHRYTWEQRKSMRQFALELFAEEMNAIEAQKNVDKGYMYISLVRDRLKVAFESPEFSGVRDVQNLSPDLLEYEAIAWRQVWNSVGRILKEQAAMREAMKSELEKENP